MSSAVQLRERFSLIVSGQRFEESDNFTDFIIGKFFTELSFTHNPNRLGKIINRTVVEIRVGQF